MKLVRDIVRSIIQPPYLLLCRGEYDPWGSFKFRQPIMAGSDESALEVAVNYLDHMAARNCFRGTRYVESVLIRCREGNVYSVVEKKYF